MLAVVKMPRTNKKILEIKGDISNRFIKYLHKEYGDNITIQDDDEYVDIVFTAWYKNQKKRKTPGKSLKVYRKRDGLTQAQLGKNLGGISAARISDFEHDRRGISKDIAKKLAELFGTSLERFI
ncbi:helix-turn-helix domain-containing protein [Candidatus Omnitrophota bacterium]